MAQLSDDCFAFGGELLTVAAALQAIATIDCVSAAEFVPVDAADGRVLAEDVIAPGDLPPFDNAAVDGYAVRLADVCDGAALPVDGRLAAGAALAAPLKPGTARRIFTGAVLPAGANTIFMQEDVRLDDEGRVHLPAGLKQGANTRPRGEDIAAGVRALRQGQMLHPRHLALAAALGFSELAVRAPVRVALFSTGNELVDAGRPTAAGQRHDSNRVLLAALARRAGALITDLGILPDRRDTIAAALAEAAHCHDLIMTSGGVSVGEEDHVRSAVEASGRLTFWRLAIKPGRPVAMGTVAKGTGAKGTGAQGAGAKGTGAKGTGAGTPFVGLPGNPVAAFITFVHVARPLIAALAGARIEPAVRFPVRAAFSYRKKAGRREYVRVRIEPGDDGSLTAHKHPVEGAGILTSLTETAGLVELPEPVTRVAPGDSVLYLPYELLL